MFYYIYSVFQKGPITDDLSFCRRVKIKIMKPFLPIHLEEKN